MQSNSQDGGQRERERSVANPACVAHRRPNICILSKGLDGITRCLERVQAYLLDALSK